MADLAKSFQLLSPIYIDSFATLVPSFRDFISANITSGDELVITSRLDNDDVIHEEFIDTIQGMALRSNMIIDLRKGFQMCILGNWCEFRSVCNCFNPFISIVESARDIRTVMSRQHDQWEGFGTVVAYDKRPMWMETVHNLNKINRVRRCEPLKWQVSLREFGISNELSRGGLLYILKNNVALWLRQVHREFRQTACCRGLRRICREIVGRPERERNSKARKG